MGCCLSKDHEELFPREKQLVHPATRHTEPPPEPEEETVVKEVLSETPRPRVSRAAREEEGKGEARIEKRYSRELNGCDDQRSEDTSEICSLSEGTFSVSTTVTEKMGEGDAKVVKKKTEETSPAKFRKKRSFSGELSCKRGRCAAASAGVGCRSGRSSLSPARRKAPDAAVGRTLSAREAESTGARVRVPAGTGRRRDPGDRSASRSGSPAGKRASELRPAARHCRSTSAPRPSGRASPHRVRPAATEYGVRCDSEACGEQSGGKESLDNPLVSLECFIFL